MFALVHEARAARVGSVVAPPPWWRCGARYAQPARLGRRPSAPCLEGDGPDERDGRFGQVGRAGPGGDPVRQSPGTPLSLPVRRTANGERQASGFRPQASGTATANGERPTANSERRTLPSPRGLARKFRRSGTNVPVPGQRKTHFHWRRDVAGGVGEIYRHRNASGTGTFASVFALRCRASPLRSVPYAQSPTLSPLRSMTTNGVNVQCRRRRFGIQSPVLNIRRSPFQPFGNHRTVAGEMDFTSRIRWAPSESVTHWT